MGTIRKGALGGFSGKAGSIIGSSWRDINYIKGLPKLSNKPKTEKQLNIRSLPLTIRRCNSRGAVGAKSMLSA